MARDIVRCTSELFSLEVADNGDGEDWHAREGPAIADAEPLDMPPLPEARASAQSCTEIVGGGTALAKTHGRR